MPSYLRFECNLEPLPTLPLLVDHALCVLDVGERLLPQLHLLLSEREREREREAYSPMVRSCEMGVDGSGGVWVRGSGRCEEISREGRGGAREDAGRSRREITSGRCAEIPRGDHTPVGGCHEVSPTPLPRRPFASQARVRARAAARAASHSPAPPLASAPPALHACHGAARAIWPGASRGHL